MMKEMVEHPMEVTMSGSDEQYTEFFEDIQEYFERLVRSGDNEVVSWQNIFEYMKKPENATFLRDLAEDTALVIYSIIYDRVDILEST